MTDNAISRPLEPVEIVADFPLALGTITSFDEREADGLSHIDAGSCRAVLKVG